MSKTGKAVLPYKPYAVKDTLPDVPSEFIAVLLRAIKAMERSKLYRIDMDACMTWERGPGSSGFQCTVGAAGALMVKELGVPFGELARPRDYRPDITKKLYAADSLRRSRIDLFLDHLLGRLEILRKPVPSTFPQTLVDKFRMPDCMVIPPYKDNPVEFKQRLKQLAQLLRNEGY